LISYFGVVFEFLRLINWFLGVAKVFIRCCLVKMSWKKKSLGKNTFISIFQAPLWWLDFRQISDTSFASTEDMSPNLFNFLNKRFGWKVAHLLIFLKNIWFKLQPMLFFFHMPKRAGPLDPCIWAFWWFFLFFSLYLCAT